MTEKFQASQTPLRFHPSPTQEPAVTTNDNQDVSTPKRHPTLRFNTYAPETMGLTMLPSISSWETRDR